MTAGDALSFAVTFVVGAGAVLLNRSTDVGTLVVLIGAIEGEELLTVLTGAFEATFIADES